MGIETIAIVATAAGLAGSAYSAVQQNRAQKKAAGAQKDAADTSAALQKNQEMEARRKQIREQRIRAAQIEQSASNQGVSYSSGQLGSISALTTNVGSNLAAMSAQNYAANGIGQANQTAVNAQSSSQQWGMYGSLFGGVTSLAGSAASSFAKADTSQPAPITRNDTYQ